MCRIMRNKILLVDDDRHTALFLSRILKEQYQLIVCNSGAKALDLLKQTAPDLIICELNLRDMEGLALLSNMRKEHPPVPLIFISAKNDIRTAVEAMKHGAVDYVVKPFGGEKMLATIKEALELNAGSNLLDQATDGMITKNILDDVRTAGINDPDYIFGDDNEFRKILNQIDLVAPTNYSVIITGETGSGKESIAREIHARSKRSNEPFVSIDCGALPRELASSELFGHEKGAFTGAQFSKIGLLEQANGGTVFLDEIANLSYDTQVSLLRVVQEKSIRKVGGNKDIKLDIRFILASNETLKDAVRSGHFREDLYFRFNEFTINVPPLRQRKSDIILFARFFLFKSNIELNKQLQGFHVTVEQMLMAYEWPGNLRELKNVVRRAALMATGNMIVVEDLPVALINSVQASGIAGVQVEEPITDDDSVTDLPGDTISVNKKELPNYLPNHSTGTEKREADCLKNAGADAEYQMVLWALKKAKFNKSKAAKLLNVDRKTLYNKLDKFKALNLG